ncbi:MAG TPA: class I SAM-dependent methyltransferase [Candidatus Methanoperedens sp.]|nr:class I SAM-dependent methyltransferase [Candidatus Methanoperedens sp.]
MVIRRALKSIGFMHPVYLAYRFLLLQARMAFADVQAFIAGKDYDGLPLPPARLRFRVHGDLRPDAFVRVGRNIAGDLRGLAAEAGQPLASSRTILDFGCGAGRVMRNFRDCAGAARLYGTDIDRDLVAWCRNNLRFATWCTNGFAPPLPFEDGFFDFIYGISVFTHLDEAYQHAWLGELSRIARPGGLVLLTTMGEQVVRNMPQAVQDSYASLGFAHKIDVVGRFKFDQLPDFYQSTFHSEAYVRRVWSAYFSVVAFKPRAINKHQDAVVLRKQ